LLATLHSSTLAGVEVGRTEYHPAVPPVSRGGRLMTADRAAGTLPDLAATYRTSRQALARFRRDGHVKLDAVFTPEEIAVYRPHLKRLVEHDGGAGRATKGRTPNLNVRTNLWAVDDSARRFVLSRRLGRIAADLLGVDAVRLLGDQSYFKPPRSFNTPWHQDGHAVPLDDPDRTVTLWVPLTKMTPALAPMTYLTGARKSPSVTIAGPDAASMDRFEDEMRAQGRRLVNYGTFEAGAVAAHGPWTFHSSRNNATARMREVLVIVYFADGARVARDPAPPPDADVVQLVARQARQQNAARSLPGLRPGARADGPTTPLVYRRRPRPARP
jgi:hypothetical protein